MTPEECAKQICSSHRNTSMATKEAKEAFTLKYVQQAVATERAHIAELEKAWDELVEQRTAANNRWANAEKVIQAVRRCKKKIDGPFPLAAWGRVEMALITYDKDHA